MKNHSMTELPCDSPSQSVKKNNATALSLFGLLFIFISLIVSIGLGAVLIKPSVIIDSFFRFKMEISSISLSGKYAFHVL